MVAPRPINVADRHVERHFTRNYNESRGDPYATQVTGGGPVGYWRLGDSGNQAVDAGPNGSPGITWQPAARVGGALAGDANTAVDFTALADA